MTIRDSAIAVPVVTRKNRTVQLCYSMS